MVLTLLAFSKQLNLEESCTLCHIVQCTLYTVQSSTLTRMSYIQHLRILYVHTYVISNNNYVICHYVCMYELALKNYLSSYLLLEYSYPTLLSSVDYYFTILLLCYVIQYPVPINDNTLLYYLVIEYSK